MIIIFGVRFDVPNEYDHILVHILENMAIDKFVWITEYEDVFTMPYKENFNLFPKARLTGAEFAKAIAPPVPYYICFAKLLAFTSEEAVQPISTFREFFECPCELIIFFTDAVFVEIYSQEEDLLKIIIKNAKQNGYQNIEFIHQLDGRDLDLMKR